MISIDHKKHERDRGCVSLLFLCSSLNPAPRV